MASRLLTRLKRNYRGLFGDQAVVVAGMGRCGTTLVFRSLRDDGYTPHPSFLETIDLGSCLNGHVYKTHEAPPAAIGRNVKLVFMFGNPMDIAISSHSRMNRWGRVHHMHLGSDLFTDNDCVFMQDTLKLEAHFDAWHRPQSFPFVTVRYETLYSQDTLDGLADFLGHRIILPPHRARTTRWMDHPRKEQLLEIYSDLHDRIEQAANITVWDPA
jgi:hypothetical protein